jgi:hypothetical protein
MLDINSYSDAAKIKFFLSLQLVGYKFTSKSLMRDMRNDNIYLASKSTVSAFISKDKQALNNIKFVALNTDGSRYYLLKNNNFVFGNVKMAGEAGGKLPGTLNRIKNIYGDKLNIKTIEEPKVTLDDIFNGKIERKYEVPTSKLLCDYSSDELVDELRKRLAK